MRGGAVVRGLLAASPLRMALGLVTIFLAVGFVSVGLVFVELRAEVRDTVDASLSARTERLSRIAADPQGPRTIAQEAAMTDPETGIVALIHPDGPAIGNADVKVAGGRVVALVPTRGDRLDLSAYAFAIRPTAAGLLVVGQSLAPLDELQEAFLRILSFGLLPTAALSLVAAVLAGLWSSRRVERIETALDRIATGDLTARVGERARHDDLARIAAGVDRMADAQQAHVETLRQVSADFAHDLKTPMQRLSVILSDLSRRLPGGSPEADLAGLATAEADRAVALFQSLLQIAQIESGSPRARFAPVDLGRLVADVSEIYGPVAEDAGRSIDVKPVPEAAVTVTGDRQLLGRALSNLIENALRHAPGASPIVISLTAAPDGAALAVADRGPGIAIEDRDRVTRRFHRLDQSRSTEGHGLGLALVRAVAEAHGGQLVLSDNHPGLRAELRLPVSPEASIRPERRET